MSAKLYCSFCMQSQEEVEVMIAAPVHVAICGECVEICASIVKAKRAEMHRERDVIQCATCQPTPLQAAMAFTEAFLNGAADHG